MDTLHTLYKTPLHKRITKDSPCAVGDRKRGRGRAVRLRRAPLDRLVRGEPWEIVSVGDAARCGAARRGIPFEHNRLFIE
jgi:hypothetical protein